MKTLYLLSHDTPTSTFPRLLENLSRAQPWKASDTACIIGGPEPELKSPIRELTELIDCIAFESDLLMSPRQPSAILAQLPLHERILIEQEILKNQHVPDWHYSDEENHADRMLRAKRVIEDLDDHHDALIFVILHASFVPYLIAAMAFPQLSPQQFRSLQFFMPHNPECITRLSQDDLDPTYTGWKLQVWNGSLVSHTSLAHMV